MFTPKAIIDYREMAPFPGNRAEAKAWLAIAMAGIGRCQHVVSTSQIKIDGDRAFGRTVCTNPMVSHLSIVGLWYRDEMLRTTDGWRITHRDDESSWRFNAADGLLSDPRRGARRLARQWRPCCGSRSFGSLPPAVALGGQAIFLSPGRVRSS